MFSDFAGFCFLPTLCLPLRADKRLPLLSSRRYRHLMTDITALLPHSKKDNKLDTKNDRGLLNEVRCSELNVCCMHMLVLLRKQYQRLSQRHRNDFSHVYCIGKDKKHAHSSYTPCSARKAGYDRCNVTPNLLALASLPTVNFMQFLLYLLYCIVLQVADMKGCSSVLFFEVRKKTDLYLWMAKSPEGPCVKVRVDPRQSCLLGCPRLALCTLAFRPVAACILAFPFFFRMLAFSIATVIRFCRLAFAIVPLHWILHCLHTITCTLLLEPDINCRANRAAVAMRCKVMSFRNHNTMLCLTLMWEH